MRSRGALVVFVAQFSSVQNVESREALGSLEMLLRKSKMVLSC